MSRTTPWGSWRMKRRNPAFSGKASSARAAGARRHIVSARSIIVLISFRDCWRGLPIWRVMSRATASAICRNAGTIWATTLTRSPTATLRHARWAARARSMMRASSRASVKATVRNGSSVAGLTSVQPGGVTGLPGGLQREPQHGLPGPDRVLVLTVLSRLSPAGLAAEGPGQHRVVGEKALAPTFRFRQHDARHVAQQSRGNNHAHRGSPRD